MLHEKLEHRKNRVPLLSFLPSPISSEPPLLEANLGGGGRKGGEEEGSRGVRVVHHSLKRRNAR